MRGEGKTKKMPVDMKGEKEAKRKDHGRIRYTRRTIHKEREKGVTGEGDGEEKKLEEKVNKCRGRKNSEKRGKRKRR